MQEEDVVKTITGIVGFISIYVLLKVNGHIEKAFFPFPQIDRGVMFLWEITPYIVGGIIALGFMWLLLWAYQDHLESKAQEALREKEQFKQEIISELETILGRLNEGRVELTESVLARLQNLEEGIEALKPPVPEQIEVADDFELEKLI